MNPSKDYLSRNEECAYQIVDGEAVIVRLLADGDSRVLSLNPTATFVWQLADGKATIAEIGRRLAERYQVDTAEVTADTAALAKDLKSRGLALIGPRGDR